MKGSNKHLTRRTFLKLTGLSMGVYYLLQHDKGLALAEFLDGDRLGRVNVGKVELKSKPDIDSQTVGDLYEDTVVLWLREIVGRNTFRTNQRWVETPDGFLWSPYLQPVRSMINDH